MSHPRYVSLREHLVTLMDGWWGKERFIMTLAPRLEEWVLKGPNMAPALTCYIHEIVIGRRMVFNSWHRYRAFKL